MVSISSSEINTKVYDIITTSKILHDTGRD